jgi:hypothetical protein
MIPPITTSRQVNDLVRDVEEGRLLLKPPFQRRTVWTPSVKDHFLETVSLGLPFPEIFVVTGHTDPATRTRVDHLVDGQQRVSALREYLNGSKDISYKKVRPYAQLSPDDQQRFLSYPVAVRDLRMVDAKTVADIFNRINSTDYALKATERFNALFTGEYRTYCEKLAEHAFFRNHRTFSSADWKRMGDLTFTLTLVTTLLAGYFRREELLADYLGRYNDDFPEKTSVDPQTEAAFNFIDGCGFPPKCRVWKKTDLFTLIVESCFLIRTGKATLDPKAAGTRLNKFYAEVDELYKADPAGEASGSRSVSAQVLRYMKAATKATNDKYARVDRAEVIAPLLVSEPTSPKRDAKKKGK